MSAFHPLICIMHTERSLQHKENKSRSMITLYNKCEENSKCKIFQSLFKAVPKAEYRSEAERNENQMETSMTHLKHIQGNYQVRFPYIYKVGDKSRD